MGPELTRPLVQNMVKQIFWDRSRWNYFFSLNESELVAYIINEFWS